MSDQSSLLQGSFRLQYSELPEGRLRIFYVVDEKVEIGPLELERREAEELGQLLDRAALLLSRTHSRAEQHATVEETRQFAVAPEADDDDDRVPPLRTDPSALSRKRRLR